MTIQRACGLKFSISADVRAVGRAGGSRQSPLDASAVPVSYELRSPHAPTAPAARGGNQPEDQANDGQDQIENRGKWLPVPEQPKRRYQRSKDVDHQGSPIGISS